MFPPNPWVALCANLLFVHSNYLDFQKNINIHHKGKVFRGFPKVIASNTHLYDSSQEIWPVSYPDRNRSHKLIILLRITTSALPSTPSVSSMMLMLSPCQQVHLSSILLPPPVDLCTSPSWSLSVCLPSTRRKSHQSSLAPFKSAPHVGHPGGQWCTPQRPRSKTII